MLTHLKISNYQSHVDTDIELAPLTVIVGQSSAGKSAFVRAITALASNQTGKEFITHGESTMQIQATSDKGILTFTKGKPEDSYVILSKDDEKNPRKYTKLGTSVPQDVSDFLGIASKDQINFAGQWDAPYLLRSSAAEVARVLGELTNVSTIFEASREALRRKNNFASTLKIRSEDLATVVAKDDPTLPQDLANLTIAEAALAVAQEAQSNLDQFQEVVLTLSTAKARLRQAKANNSPLPDPTEATTAYQNLERLTATLAHLSNAGEAQREAFALEENYNQEVFDYQESYVALLEELGTCPTCHQSTAALEHVGSHSHGW